MTTRIQPTLVFAQTSAGFDSTLLSNTNGWYPLDITYPSDSQRAFIGTKDAADTISIIGKAEAVNPITRAVVTVEATIAAYATGTSFSDAITAPLTAVRVQKTGATGAATVILVG